MTEAQTEHLKANILAHQEAPLSTSDKKLSGKTEELQDVNLLEDSPKDFASVGRTDSTNSNPFM